MGVSREGATTAKVLWDDIETSVRLVTFITVPISNYNVTSHIEQYGNIVFIMKASCDIYPI